MIKTLVITLLLSAVLIGANSCETDFDVNAPYEAIPVIIGVLDASQDTQFVKISKSFLGDGNNVDYASINDSLYFSNVSATVVEIENGQETNSWDLDEIWIGGIDDGIFYEDQQKLYYFVPNGGLNEDATYELTVNINEGENIVTAETEVLGDFSYKQNFTNAINLTGINLAKDNSSSTNDYPSIDPSWAGTEGGELYEAEMRFYYFEFTGTDTSRVKYSINLGRENATSSNSYSAGLKGDAFYGGLANKLGNHPNESEVIKRVPDRFEFYVSVADENLATYIEVNKPATGIVTERPSFTNIDGGIGIFASRYTIGYTSQYNNGNNKFNLSKFSFKELAIGQYTQDYKFCTDSSTVDYSNNGLYSCQ